MKFYKFYALVLLLFTFVKSVEAQTTLNAPSGAGQSNYQWFAGTSGAASPLTGENNSSYTPTTAGVYFATFDTDGCGGASEYFVLVDGCDGEEMVTLNVAGTNVTWSNGDTGNSITVNASAVAETYTATDVSGACSSVLSAFTVANLNDCDTDGDGIPDSIDLDDDNDGIPDTVEEATASNGGDTDGDGIPDSLDLDSDGDGILDVVESNNPDAVDADGDGQVDGDVGSNGLPDAVEDTPDSGTLANDPVDTDGDGMPDFQDVDSDNDGISDLVEGGTDPTLDADNDGVLDDQIDTDGDGVADDVDPDDGGTPADTPDTDMDGTPDYQDLDSDNDGINDVEESGLPDTDGDGQVDTPGTLADGDMLPDEDNNGIPDFQEPPVDPADSPLDPTEDADGDGVIDDPTDTDGDGIPDVVDGLPNDFGDAPDAVTMPDLTPTITVTPTTGVVGPTPMRVIVNIKELVDGVTNGQVIVTVPKVVPYSFTYDPVATMAGGIAVSNADWEFSENASTYIFRLKAGVEISNQLNSQFGFVGTFDAANTNGNLNFTVNILNGTGGDAVPTNNTDYEVVFFEQQ